MKELVDQIKAEYDVFVKNADAQVEKGNKAAGARARKAALNIMKMMKDFRKVSVEEAKYIILSPKIIGIGKFFCHSLYFFYFFCNISK